MTIINKRPFFGMNSLEQTLIQAMGVQDDGAKHTIKVDGRNLDIATLAEQVQVLLEGARTQGRVGERFWLTYNYDTILRRKLAEWDAILADTTALELWNPDQEDFIDQLMQAAKQRKQVAPSGA